MFLLRSQTTRIGMARGYMPQLDGVRTLAVAAVIAQHFLPLYVFIPYDFDTPGDVGVRLFFVLSGFLITRILLRCRTGAHSEDDIRSSKLRSFYARRFLRIFPVYYLTLGVIYVLNVPTVRATIFWHLSYLSNVYFFTPKNFETPVAHFWSLAVEEQFYIFWPLLIVFAPAKYLRSIILATIVAAPLFRLILFLLTGNELGPRILLFGCMDSLALGALLSYYEWKRPFDQHKRFPIFSLWAGASLLFLLLLVHLMGGALWLSITFLDLALSLVFVWLIARASTGFKGVAGKFLQLEGVVYIGKISYGIYLFHLLMVVLVPQLFERVGLTYPLGKGTTLKRFVILLTASLVCAALSWHFFEKPINNLKKYFGSSVAPVSTDQTPVAAMETA